MAKVDVRCPFCQQTPPVKKHSLGGTGHQRYRCQDSCKGLIIGIGGWYKMGIFSVLQGHKVACGCLAQVDVCLSQQTRILLNICIQSKKNNTIIAIFTYIHKDGLK